jgi:hypothetical protein
MRICWLPRGEVYDMLIDIVKTEKTVRLTELVSKIWQVQNATFAPIYGANLTIYELQEQWIAICSTVIESFNNNPTKNVYLAIIYCTRKHGILANEKPLTCIVMVQRCIFPSSPTCYFGKHARKIARLINAECYSHCPYSFFITLQFSFSTYVTYIEFVIRFAQ